MKWFKHYSDASRSEKLEALIEKTGLEGYAKYWLLVELLSEKFDGNETTFRINRRTLARQLRYYRHTMAEQWLDNGRTLGLYNYHCEGDVYVIVFDKLLEIKDNHTKNLQVKTKPIAPRIDKNRIDKNRIEKTKSVSVNFPLEKIYDAYPKKQGKQAGLKKLKSIVKKQDLFNTILESSKAYSKHCEEFGVEKQFIKNFSTWVNQQCWEDDYQQGNPEKEKYIKLIMSLDKSITRHDAEQDYLIHRS